ncbi:hypothetical protein NG895_12305 [Aeoliella sp. ICT_H6.2]|uniref:Uncharacterized protein n=1 Tax=Aeoliella straminimaris TaxID=2954799 RepID=A0A9X2FFC8_9BACT|nr:hypothetical protein [Aeoliella straminimaris]MCO6044691.1 hypothetical protein [Aeoliella straminimaris]
MRIRFKPTEANAFQAERQRQTAEQRARELGVDPAGKSRDQLTAAVAARLKQGTARKPSQPAKPAGDANNLAAGGRNAEPVRRSSDTSERLANFQPPGGRQYLLIEGGEERLETAPSKAFRSFSGAGASFVLA